MKLLNILRSMILLSCHLFTAVNGFASWSKGNNDANTIAPCCSKPSTFGNIHHPFLANSQRPSRSQQHLNLFTEPTILDTVAVAAANVDTIHSLLATSSPSILLSETEPWVKPMSQILGPFLNLFSFAMLCRVVISWYPKSNLNEFPYNVVVWPTEPLLRAIRGTVPPAFGVDITPIVWLAVFTFFNEILLGQQGLLTMKMKYGI
mmetsp:Transcript_16040/g.30276  ORF Transcript_16040/g.30276 Transcript_16040/m.30276 type:complete len:205 (+) Transcript_16040:256-870(+)